MLFILIAQYRDRLCSYLIGRWVCVQVYDLMAGSKLVVPPSHYMSKAEAMFNFPKLKDEVRST